MSAGASVADQEGDSSMSEAMSDERLAEIQRVYGDYPNPIAAGFMPAELLAEVLRLKAQAARDAALVGLVLEEARLRLTRDDPGLITDWVIYQDWQDAAGALRKSIRARIEQEDQACL